MLELQAPHFLVSQQSRASCSPFILRLQSVFILFDFLFRCGRARRVLQRKGDKYRDDKKDLKTNWAAMASSASLAKTLTAMIDKA